MGKLVTILGACVVATAGAGYAVYSYSEQTTRSTGCATSAAKHSCCAGLEAPSASADTSGEAPAMAVAGPLALFATVPVKAEGHACCLTKSKAKATVAHACCMDEDDAPAANGLVALTGTAVGVAKK